MRRVLIVEDDTDLQHLFKSVLKKASLVTTILSDGRSLFDNALPDLYIFDIELPHINGLELCKQVKSDSRTRHIPVLIVSGSAHLLEKAKEFSADDALEKPFERRHLVEHVLLLLAKRAIA